MITVKLKGGLGNQMFQYAFGYSIARRNSTRLNLNLDWFSRGEKEQQQPGAIARPCDILDMNLDFDQPAEYPREHFKFSLLNKLRNKFLPVQWRAYHLEKSLDFKPAMLTLGHHNFIEGFWHSPHYFNDFGDDMKRQFIPKIISAHADTVFAAIDAVPSVAIHIRRGDYASVTEVKNIHGVMEIDYYQSAIAFIRSQVKECVFFIFSDDWNWVSQHLPEGKQFVYVTAESAVADMYLMSRCKHQIIANSTFSWWGAWLNSYPEKVVVAPANWYADPVKQKETASLVPGEWIRI